MINIKIGRFTNDPHVKGVVKPDDDSWQLVIDADGYPHLYIRCKIGPGPDGEAAETTPTTGLLCIEDLLPDELKIRDLMQGEFGGELSAEEQADVVAEYDADRERHPIPCPR